MMVLFLASVLWIQHHYDNSNTEIEIDHVQKCFDEIFVVLGGKEKSVNIKQRSLQLQCKL